VAQRSQRPSAGGGDAAGPAARQGRALVLFARSPVGVPSAPLPAPQRAVLPGCRQALALGTPVRPTERVGAFFSGSWSWRTPGRAHGKPEDQESCRRRQLEQWASRSMLAVHSSRAITYHVPSLSACHALGSVSQKSLKRQPYHGNTIHVLRNKMLASCWLALRCRLYGFQSVHQNL